MPAHVDSQQLRSFAAQLQRFCAIAEENMSRTQGQMNRLSETWRDPEFESFRESFVKMAPILRQFVEEGRATIPKLNADADAVDDYATLKTD